MSRILTKKYYLCLFLALPFLERSYANEIDNHRHISLSETKEVEDYKKANVITSFDDNNGNLFIFNDPTILNIQNLNEIKTEAIANLKESSMGKISNIKASLCSLFRVCNFEMF